eukprot:355741-Rhodomonas_salina.1
MDDDSDGVCVRAECEGREPSGVPRVWRNSAVSAHALWTLSAHPLWTLSAHPLWTLSAHPLWTLSAHPSAQDYGLVVWGPGSRVKKCLKQ